MKRYEIKKTWKTSDFSGDNEDCYESGYQIIDNLYGDYIYEFTDKETADFYRKHNYNIEEG